MGIESKIQWTDATINFWHGCIKVSPGCKYCYMYRDKETRYGQDPRNIIKRKTKDILRDLKKIEPGKKIFTCSWSDFFIQESDNWRVEAWQIIREHPQFIWQILTKRPERILKNLPDDWEFGYENVWLGPSAENEETLKKRYWDFREVPAKQRILSLEPLLSNINLQPYLNNTRTYVHGKSKHWSWGGDHTRKSFDWVIIGGESGNDTGFYRYRPCEIEWIEKIIEDCKASGIPVFVKQLGTSLAKKLKLKDRHGGNVQEWPESLRIREFPL